MEVHHHAHKPKNWKEYFTEFMMLFLAVSTFLNKLKVQGHLDTFKIKQF